MNSLTFITRGNLLKRSGLLTRFAWWGIFLVCAFYSAYAFFMAGVEVLHRMGIVADAPHRAVPPVFLIHAVSGAVLLLSGPLQFSQSIRTAAPKVHRILGRIYVSAIWISSIGGLWSTLFFDVNLAAKFALGMLSVLWFGTTTIALVRIRQRDVSSHRAWMIRSFALSFFFVTFSFWVPGIASTPLPEAIGYPLAVSLSWSVNLAVAEWWILRTQPQRLMPQTRGEF